MKLAKRIIGGVAYTYLIVFLFYRVYKMLDMNFFEELLYFSAYLSASISITVSLLNLVEYRFLKEDIYTLIRRFDGLVIVVSFAIFLFGTQIDVQCIAGYIGYAFIILLIFLKLIEK